MTPHMNLKYGNMELDPIVQHSYEISWKYFSWCKVCYTENEHTHTYDNRSQWNEESGL